VRRGEGGNLDAGIEMGHFKQLKQKISHNKSLPTEFAVPAVFLG
jgi:hypothetical protein